MKRILGIAFAFVALAGLNAWAQEAGSKKGGAKKAAAKSEDKTTTLQGTVGADGKTFTNDKDKKSWKVTNPEAFKGHEGHHVSVSAHVYPDKNEIHVMSVKMLTEGKKKK